MSFTPSAMSGIADDTVLLEQSLYNDTLGVGEEGVLGFWTCGVCILGATIVSYVLVAIGVIIIQRIPKIGKYLIG